MKIGDYFLVSDLQRLSEEQYNSLVTYIKFMGVACRILYKDIVENPDGDPDVVVVDDCWDGTMLLWSYFGDEEIVNCIPYDDILRIISLGGWRED